MKPLVLCLLLIIPAASAYADEWQTITGCRLIDNEANDGDSFHVKADVEERIFRLYFADTPEAESDGYVTERVTEQAKDFGITALNRAMGSGSSLIIEKTCFRVGPY